MPQLQLSMTDEEIQDLTQYAQELNRPVDSLIKEYLAYLLAGGDPITGKTHDLPTGNEIAELATLGKSFDWLADEPELYSREDGEPV